MSGWRKAGSGHRQQSSTTIGDMKKGLLKQHREFVGQFQSGADGANHPEKGQSMSRRALWAPKQLETWDWRQAIVEEKQTKTLPFQSWARPDATTADTDSGGSGAKRSAVDRSKAVALIGFTVAGLAAMTSVLSMIYGQLVSALTGFPTAPLLPIGVLATSFVVGAVTGTLGIVLGAKWSRDAVANRQSKKPDNSIAA